MKNDLGFILLDLQTSPNHDYVINEISTIIKNNPYNQVCVFNNYTERFDNKNVPLLPLNQAKYFDGDLFLLDSISLMMSKQFPLAKRRYLYVDSIIWQDNYNTYELWNNLLTQDNMHYIVTNQKIADLIEICWSKKSHIMEHFNAKEIIDVLQ